MSSTPKVTVEGWLAFNINGSAKWTKGCTCPVIDNHYGKGVPAGKEGAPLFWHSERCPLHGTGALDPRPQQSEVGGAKPS